MDENGSNPLENNRFRMNTEKIKGTKMISIKIVFLEIGKKLYVLLYYLLLDQNIIIKQQQKSFCIY